jgi:hypothetical protein
LDKHRSEPSWSRVLGAAKLRLKSLGTEEGNRLPSLCREGSVGDPQVQVERTWRGGKDANRIQIRWDWMFSDLSEELVTQDDHVLPVACRVSPRWIAVEPDMGLANKVESGSGEQFGPFSRTFAAKEDCGTEDPFDAGDQTAILLPSLLHAEHLQHLRTGSESESLALLADGESREEDQNQPVLPEWKATVGVTKQLKFEPSVAALEEKVLTRRAPHRQPAEHEGPGGESEPRPATLRIGPNPVDSLQLSMAISGDSQFRLVFSEQVPDWLEAERTVFRIGRWLLQNYCQLFRLPARCGRLRDDLQSFRTECQWRPDFVTPFTPLSRKSVGEMLTR